MAEFEQALQTPPEMPASDGDVAEIPKAKIEPRSEPARHRLTKLWTASDVKMPGNVFVVEAPAQAARPKLLVVDSWNSVIEVGWDGSVTARHELPLPSDGAVSTLRSATDGAGKRYFTAFLTAQQQFHLFDQDWKPLLSFPAAGDPKHEGIGDVQFTDLDGDGTLEMAVGYWGDVGLQYVTLDGKRTWTDRTLQFVLRLAASGADENGKRRLLAANSHGTVGVFSAEGKPAEAVTLVGRPMQTLYAADLDGNGQPELCGLSYRSLGANSLVGFDLEGKELWSYDLPTGVHEKPIEPITPARLLGKQGQWLAAAADGSVHILGGRRQADRQVPLWSGARGPRRCTNRRRTGVDYRQRRRFGSLEAGADRRNAGYAGWERATVGPCSPTSLATACDRLCALSCATFFLTWLAMTAGGIALAIASGYWMPNVGPVARTLLQIFFSIQFICVGVFMAARCALARALIGGVRRMQLGKMTLNLLISRVGSTGEDIREEDADVIDSPSSRLPASREISATIAAERLRP